jgi:nucleoside phosphorylase
MGSAPRPTVGVITALPIECFAVQLVLDGVRAVRAPEADDGASYWIGTVPSSRPDEPHQVVLSLLPEDGGIAAAHGCVNLQRSWRVDQVVMCGIACGVPRPDDPSRHVRLGDILVAEDGVVPYGHVRVVGDGSEELRRAAPKPSVAWKNAARRLRVATEAGVRPWESVMESRGRRGVEDYSRPPPGSDVLIDDDGNVVPHPRPRLTGHPSGHPKVHDGRLGSGGKLINNAAERSRLARAHRLIGFDMEGDGVSDAAYLQRVDWFMVRGVSDYGIGKSDRWHRYASLAAAAYVRSLLHELDPFSPRFAGRPAAWRTVPMTSDKTSPGRPMPVTVERHQQVVDAVWGVRTMREQDGRDQVVSALTAASGARIARSRDAYRDVDSIVRSLSRLPGGLVSLVRVLRGIEDDSIPLRQLVILLDSPAGGDVGL